MNIAAKSNTKDYGNITVEIMGNYIVLLLFIYWQEYLWFEKRLVVSKNLY